MCIFPQQTFEGNSKHEDAYYEIRHAAEAVVQMVEKNDIKKIAFLMDGTLNQKFHDDGEFIK